MSWWDSKSLTWDTKGLTSFAQQALKTAQKKIDKVLDIKEEEEREESQENQYDKTGYFSSTSSPQGMIKNSPDVEDADNFFSLWLSPPASSHSPTSAQVYKSHTISSLSPSSDYTSLGHTSDPADLDDSKPSAISRESGDEILTKIDGSEAVDTALTFQSGLPKQRIGQNPDETLSSSIFEDSEQFAECETGSVVEQSRQFSADEMAEDCLVKENIAVIVGYACPSRKDNDIQQNKSEVSAAFVPTESLVIADTCVSNVTSSFTFSNLGSVSVADSSHLQNIFTCSNESNNKQMLAGPTLDLSDFDTAAKDYENIDTCLSNAKEKSKCDIVVCSLMPNESAATPLSAGRVKNSELLENVDITSSFDGGEKVVAGGADTAVKDKLTNSQLSEDEMKVGMLNKIPSLEGSIETSADELSEGNKTIVADDSDFNRDDTDVDELRLDTVPMDEQCKEARVDSMHLKEYCSTSAAVCVQDSLVADECRSSFAQIFSDDLSETKDSAEVITEIIINNGSYIKNLLEEAMADGSARDSAGSVRNESGGNSGHTSADEIDTTTSSDIEIISHTSANVPASISHSVRPFDVSPSRHYGTWSTRVPFSAANAQHHRSDSGSSAQSLQSRTEEDFTNADLNRHVTDCEGHTGEYQETQLLSTKNYSDVVTDLYDVDKLLKKLSEMAKLLEAREKKQLELSHQNMELVEMNNILCNRLQKLEHASETDMDDHRATVDEYSRRIADAERRLQMAIREKEALKASLHDAETEIAKRSDNIVTEKLLKEKEQIIAELMEEGEKLSKKQLQNNNTIKKLRTKEKENEGLMNSQKQKIDEQKTEIERLERLVDSKVDTEKKHIDTINQLGELVKAQEEEINRLKNELEDGQEKYRGIKVALDNSYKEISELHKARATHVSEAQKAALDVEVSAKEQLRIALDECSQRARQEQAMLVTQIEDLQLSLSRLEKDHGRREDLLRQEIADLQQRLQEAEERNQELTHSVTGATRPLLRQIENLQSTFAAQSSSYERVEKSLTDRLVETQSQLASAVEKERFANEKLIEANLRLTSLDSQNSSLRQERSQLVAELEVERTKVELAEEAKNNEIAQREAARQKIEVELSELKKEKVLLENQIEMERMKIETGKKKVALLHDQLHEKEMMLQMRSPAASSPTYVKEDPVTASTPTQSLELNDKMFLMGSANGSRASVYDSLRQTSGASLIESLQSELKQREGEIQQLQSEIAELERTRESMARELVNLCIQNEDLTEKLKNHATFQLRYVELDQRYNALLQMYGEKVEEAQELRLDLEDIKDMYKTQIDELLKSKSTTLQQTL